MKIVKNLEQYFEIEDIDIGTGLGIPYSDNDKEIKLFDLRNKIFDLLKEFGFEDKNFLMETGRFLVGSSGIYVTDIIDKKDSRGETFLIARGGMNHLLRPSLINSNHQTIVIDSESLEKQIVSIAGQLCTSLDFIAKNVELPRIDIGNLIGILQCGAYGYTESMPFFLSHSTPKEILIRDGETHIIRDSINIEDVLRWQKLV